MIINPDNFFKTYREAFGERLNQSQVDGLNDLIKFFKFTPKCPALNQAAYMLATIKHECANTWLPIEERGTAAYFDKYDPPTKIAKRLGNKKRGDGITYKGRGYVQITGRANYAKMNAALKIPEALNLIQHPKNALQPALSFEIMVYGMTKGTFTGKKLDDYINHVTTDYKNARRIINGMDDADLIAGYAEKFEVILKQSV
jgi:hypothetical protein